MTKTPGTYTKSDDPKITPKETLTYPMRYKTKTLTGVTPDIASHQHASAAWKRQLPFWQWLTPNVDEYQLVLYMAQVLSDN